MFLLCVFCLFIMIIILKPWPRYDCTISVIDNYSIYIFHCNNGLIELHNGQWIWFFDFLCSVEDEMDGICTFSFNSFPHVYDCFPCSLWNGITMFIINVLCAFGWTYNDRFIVLMSVALADRFRQLNRCLKSIQGEVSLFQQIRCKNVMPYNLVEVYWHSGGPYWLPLSSIPLKCQQTSTILHGITSQKIVLFIFAVMKISNLKFSVTYDLSFLLEMLHHANMLLKN
jgi:hypothetical protein